MALELLSLLKKTALEKCDLVTREEFEIQAEVLAKTREKLEILERKIKELENIKNN